ncbi:MAG: spore maturation protein [Firmicutes bacterium]|nr:spore maturation protein [Bacillota bacterium]
MVAKLIIPIFILIIIFYGLIKKIDIYESFLTGVKEGLVTVYNICPSIIAMVFAVNIFLNSNFLENIFSFLNPLLLKLNIPIDIIPMALLRPISGTASLSIMNDIFSKYGPDSFAGLLSSTIQGSTDTTIYVLALYYGSVRISKIKHTLINGLFADLVGIITSFIVVYLLFC